jgi:lysyl-tRNA synthetase class 2
MNSDAWQPTATLENLRQRAAAVRWFREYFWQARFWEVETPLLSRETVVDRHLEPPCLSGEALGVGQHLPGDWFLQTSPEFGMKRLLAAGAERIFQLGKAFRAGEAGRLHNPEFTMLEWYDANAGYEEGIEFLQGLARAFFQKNECSRESYTAAWCRALSQRFGHSPEFGLQLLQAGRESAWKIVASQLSLDAGQLASLDQDGRLHLVWAECVEPELGKDSPTIIYDWPASQAALARTRKTAEGSIAERFELYYQGVELANGYHELVDADELASRARRNNEERLGDGKRKLPEGSRLESALRIQPRLGAGVAAGVDRWVMLKLGCQSLAEVIAFPIERA